PAHDYLASVGRTQHGSATTHIPSSTQSRRPPRSESRYSFARRIPSPARVTGRPTGGALTMTRLLDGIRVIDAANFIAGPVSTTIMADFGADVIKVEPPTGDVYRVRGAGYPPSPYNYPWILDN